MTQTVRLRMRAKNLDPSVRKQILKLDPQLSQRRIAKVLGLSRKLVTTVLEEEGRLPRIASENANKLSPFREALAERVAKDLTATRILRELKELGYQGGRTILAEEVSRLRAHLPLQKRQEVKRRFETPVAFEIQVDWSPGTVAIKGIPTKIHVLGMILSHCRKLFYAIYREERLPTLLEGLATGFEYFRGVTVRCVFDNMTTVVLGRVSRERKPIWNPRFLEFARHYGFEPYLCAVREPNRKGKKEKAFRLVFADFLKGSTFESWDDMQQRLRQWLDHTPGAGNLRKHGTTGLVPNEAWLAECNLLIRLPEHRFPTYQEEPRAVDQDSTLSVRGVRYTVPAVLAFRQAVVRLHAEHFEVFDHRGNLHLSRKYVDRTIHPGTLVIDPTHYANLPKRGKNPDGMRLDQAFIKRFPTLEPLVDGLKMTMKTAISFHLRHLLRLSDQYGQTAFLAAATKAQEFRRFDAYAVKRILEQEHPLPDEDLTTTVSPSGVGVLLLGEVEEGDLDSFSHLDHQPATSQEDENDDDK